MTAYMFRDSSNPMYDIVLYIWIKRTITQDRREPGNQKYEIIIPRMTKFHPVAHDHGLNWVGLECS